MSDSLSTLIDKVQDLLLDGSGTLFSTATCTAALRQALYEFNQEAPIFATTLMTGVDNQLEYELTGEADAEHALALLGLYLQGANEQDTVLDYDAYSNDERVWFRLREPVSSSDILIAHFSVPHTINGLDGEVESTPTAFHDQVLVNGGCYHACIIRAASRVEANNLDQASADNYREIAARFRRLFDRGLMVARSKKSPVGEPDTRAWNDRWHREAYP